MSKESKPESIKSEPWTGFEKQPYKMLKDDYAYEKYLVFKASQNISKATVNLKSSWVQKGGALKITDEVKSWVNIWDNKSVYVRVKGNTLKLQYDNGITEPITGHKYNFYGSLQANQELKQRTLKLGACFISDNILCNNRLRLKGLEDEKGEKGEKGEKDIKDRNNKNIQNISFYHKSQYLKNDWKLGIYGAYDISNNVLLNNAILLGYKHKKAEYFFRLENEGWRTENPNFKQPQGYFSNAIFDCVFKLENTLKAAVELDFNVGAMGFNAVTAGFEKEYPESQSTLKLRINTKYSVAVNLKRKLGAAGSYSVGAEISDIGTKNTIKYGALFELNA